MHYWQMRYSSLNFYIQQFLPSSWQPKHLPKSKQRAHKNYLLGYAIFDVGRTVETN